MLLHTPTLLLVLLLGFALLGVQLWLTRSATLPRRELRPVEWLCWSSMTGFGFFLARDWMPRDVAGLLGILALAAGVTCFTAAVFQHVLQRLPPKAYWVLLGLTALPVLGSLAADGAVRTAVSCLVLAVLLLPPTWVALRHGWHNEVSFRIVGGTLCVTLLGLAWRALDAWWHPADYQDGQQDSLRAGLTFLFAFMGLLGSAFGFLLASFERVAQKMRRLASVDGLTGCFNHNTTHALLSHSLERARREHLPMSLLMLDLDHFKQVNDRYGHPVGDHVLREVAEAVRRCLRASDVFGRLGGEEFAVILPTGDDAGTRVLAERIRTAIERTDMRSDTGQVFHVTVSIGMAVIGPQLVLTPNEALHWADKALYQAKSQGRNRVVVADPWMLNTTIAELPA